MKWMWLIVGGALRGSAHIQCHQINDDSGFYSVYCNCNYLKVDGDILFKAFISFLGGQVLDRL